MVEFSELRRESEDLYLNLPTTSFDKLRCDLEHGKRIYWFYRDEETFCKNEEVNPYDYNFYSGIVMLFPGCITGQNDIDNFILIIDKYPTEKCNPEIHYVPFVLLLADDDVREIYDSFINQRDRQ